MPVVFSLFPYTTLFLPRRVPPRPIRLGRALAEGLQARVVGHRADRHAQPRDRKSTRLNSSHPSISYAVFCLKKKKIKQKTKANATNKQKRPPESSRRRK